MLTCPFLSRILQEATVTEMPKLWTLRICTVRKTQISCRRRTRISPLPPKIWVPRTSRHARRVAAAAMPPRLASLGTTTRWHRTTALKCLLSKRSSRRRRERYSHCSDETTTSSSSSKRKNTFSKMSSPSLRRSELRSNRGSSS